MLPALHVMARGRLLLLVATALAPPAAGQAPSPPPEPERLFQDELDLQANANFVQGSGARAFGMGGAFLARADDATAASWNPAGLSYLRLPEVSFVYAGSEFDSLKRDTAGNEALSDNRSGSFPDFLAFAWPYETETLSGAVQVSFQRVIPFPSERTIVEEDRTRTVDTDGGFDVLALGTGARVSRRFRFGFTLNRWFDGYRQVLVKSEQRVPTRQNAHFSLDGGWNLHFGAIVSPWESLNLGAVVKTGFTADVSLRRSRVDVFRPPDGNVTTTNAYGREDLSLSLPLSMGAGLSWRPRSNLTLSLDYTWSDWSRGRIRSFFTLARTPPGRQDDPPVPTESGDFYPVLPYPTLNDLRQPDTEQLRAGMEYVVIKRRLKWPLRAGYFRDRQFFRALDGSAPSLDGYTAGTGLILGRVLLDVAYVYTVGSYVDRAELHNDVKSHKVYASMIYRHPRRRP